MYDKQFLILFLNLSLCYSWQTFDNLPIYDSCTFVPFWYCKEDYSGLFDESVNTDFNPYSRISEFDICCKTDCGRRGLRINDFKPIVKKAINVRVFGNHDEAQFSEFPWMLGVILNGKYHCGASLIHPQIALTAAHCVTSAGNYIVRGGELNWDNADEPMPHQDKNVKKVTIHPNFVSRFLFNDVALLLLEFPFKINTNVGVICLSSDVNMYDSSKCILTGWGKTTSFEKGYESTLKKLDLSIIPVNSCTKQLREASSVANLRLHNSVICAGGIKKDACKGDGGSPLVCPIIGSNNRYVQVGIVAWGLTCGLTNAPGVYVNVGLFKEWIDTEIRREGFTDTIYKL